MLEVNKSNKYINVFDSIYEYYKYITTKQHKPGRAESSDECDADFSGTNNLKEAIDLMVYGDEDILKKTIEQQKKIGVEKLLGNTIKRKGYEKRVYGCVPNVPEYLIGNPINMINKELNRISHKILNIFLDLNCTGGKSKEEIARNGVLYLTVIDLLEKSGYRCNLYAGTSSVWRDNHFIVLTRVKTDREPLNIKKIGFTIAHPSMLRRIFFKWCEVNDAQFDSTGGNGYGSVLSRTKVNEDLKNELKQEFILWDFQSIEGDCSIERILDNLKKEGITINE